MAALLQSSVQVEERDAERELFSIDYVPPYGVLDEGEGLILKSFHQKLQYFRTKITRIDHCAQPKNVKFQYNAGALYAWIR